MHLPRLWKNIESRLQRESPEWQERIAGFGQVRAVEDRASGKTWKDNQVFKALLMAVLSSNTDWSKVEKVQSELRKVFLDFRLVAYADLRQSDVAEKIVPWFQARKAGSMNLRANLIDLIKAARILAKHSKTHGSAESYFTELLEMHGNDPKQLALCVGEQGSKHKLPSLGVPLAAEALKNLGFDVAKPDRHVCRAVASFGLVDFEPGGSEFQYPSPTKRRQLEAMTRVEELAQAADKPVAWVDNAIWMLGARSGLYLKNKQLAELAGKTMLQRKEPHGLLALLDSWEKEGDAEEQKETLEYLIRALDENRPEGYKLFPPELKGKSW